MFDRDVVVKHKTGTYVGERGRTKEKKKEKEGREEKYKSRIEVN